MIQSNCLNRVLIQARKYGARIRTEFHQELEYVTNMLRKEFPEENPGELKVQVFNELFHHLLCNSVHVAADASHVDVGVEQKVQATIHAQFEAIREVIAKENEGAQVQRVENAEPEKPVLILPETKIVEVATIPGAGQIMKKTKAKKLTGI